MKEIIKRLDEIVSELRSEYRYYDKQWELSDYRDSILAYHRNYYEIAASSIEVALEAIRNAENIETELETKEEVLNEQRELLMNEVEKTLDEEPNTFSADCTTTKESVIIGRDPEDDDLPF